MLRRCQACLPATRQSDSVERAFERRRRVSRWSVRWDSRSDGLVGGRNGVSGVHIGQGLGYGEARSKRRGGGGLPRQRKAGKLGGLPAAFEGGGGEGGELGGDGEDAVEFAVGVGDR